jgi:RNA polymerase sigma-70 factor, ECF subfamily
MTVAILAARTTSLEAEDCKLDSGIEMEAFLRDVERRAYRIAFISVRNADDALDIVQDAMIRLVNRYARRSQEEWRPLFYRILQNRIRDWQRRRAVRARVLSFFGGGAEEADPIADAPAPAAENPLEVLQRGDAMRALEHALRGLPRRQREAFSLRNFEGLDVAATAAAMGCSEGSVKTHYSRAVSKLRELLGEYT